MITIVKFDSSSWWRVYHQHDGTADVYKAVDQNQAFSVASEVSKQPQIDYSEHKYPNAIVLESIG